ncbi:uncharacterized protein N7477_010248 [Penicillium maclennaniae]|uniref:uncharacterized protein n=1 Tax=Penicillium maclennaniae TaxID=1343394 RepID=UPI00253F757E|nr:uncharacterized protein N7477_010248 [Penicillium maclennaniae]KAJ5662632.1 hypothetical protein N7477_010248 [Penicillium maclennaniae]
MGLPPTEQLYPCSGWTIDVVYASLNPALPALRALPSPTRMIELAKSSPPPRCVEQAGPDERQLHALPPMSHKSAI